MAFLIKILKAERLKQKWKPLLKEKDFGLNEEDSDYEFYEYCEEDPKRLWLAKFIKRIKTPDTIENFVCKSLTGFVGGVLLSYIFFTFFHIGVNFSLRISTYTCGIVGIFLCLGLAFSKKVRCYVLLVLPVFFSKQGRQALLAYALFLAFTGPAKNTMHNMRILSDSMTCGQEIVKKTLKHIAEMVKVPYKSVRETLVKLTEAINEATESVRIFITKIKRLVVMILNVIKKAAMWLRSITNLCNKKIGTPFQRCMKTFDDAITDCKAKLGVLDFLCHVVHIVKALCYTVKWLDFICTFTEFISDKMIEVVRKRLKQFCLHVKNLFDVSIEFSHSYECETKATNITREVAKTILRKISEKVEKLQSVFSFFGFMFSLLFLFLFFKAYSYKYKFLSSDKYDNVYINKYIVDLDVKRAQMDRETILPLEPREKKKYAKATSIRLLETEKSTITQSMFLLSLTSFKVITFLAVDYSLYWVLLMIYKAGRDSLQEVEKSKVVIHVRGKGILANFYQSLGKAFEVPENPYMHLTPLHCLPDPAEPDMGRYIQIGFLVGLCWILAIVESYGLRLRNVVMSHYYPDRARERAIWLYNHILRARGSFLRCARRQLRRKFGREAGKPIEKISLARRIFVGFPFLCGIFGRSDENKCLLCRITETKVQFLKKCKTPDCQGKFCLQCFASLENICTICQYPIEYGDVSDISEEIDSSEEDGYKRKTPENDRYFCQESEKFLTFKDMEMRDKFRDVEANKMRDFAKLGDLYNDKAVLKQRLRKVLNRRIQLVEETKNRQREIKHSTYKQAKSKVKDLISSLKRRKSSGFLKKKSSKTKEEEEMENLMSETALRLSKSKTECKPEENDELSEMNYEILKNLVKAKIQALKEKNTLEEETLLLDECSEEELLR